MQRQKLLKIRRLPGQRGNVLNIQSRSDAHEATAAVRRTNLSSTQRAALHYINAHGGWAELFRQHYPTTTLAVLTKRGLVRERNGWVDLTPDGRAQLKERCAE